jgi:hypothetical protein
MSAHDYTLSITDAFSGALKLYMDRFIPFLRLSAIGAVPGLIFQVVAVLYPDEILGNLFLLWLVAMAVAFVSGAVMVYAVRGAYEGNERSLPELIGDGFKRYWPLTGAFSLVLLGNVIVGTLLSLASRGYETHASLMTGVIVLLLYLMALGGAVYVMVILAFFPFAILIEGDGVWGSFRKSSILTRGTFWIVLRGHVLYFSVILAVSLPIMIGLKMLDVHPVIIAAFVETILVVFFPFLVCYYFLIYLMLKNKGTSVAFDTYDRNK